MPDETVEPAAAVARCASCGAPLRAGERFCVSCGAPTAQPASRAGASLQVPQTAAGQDEDRRHVTVVFADITNSTPLAESLDAEDFRRVLGSVLLALSKQVAAYGGTVDKYIGDAVMAVFGAPVAHEEDAERAVRAALGMQEAIARLNDETIHPQFGVRLALRIGVNTGEVVAGELGAAQHAYTVVGDAVNTAQRLQTAARPGEVLVAHETRRQLGDLFEFVPLEPLQLKGKAEPLEAFRAVRAAASIRRSARRRAASPLVGRAAELREIGERVSRLARGEGGVILITGDAGLGKSRLLREARDRAGDTGVLWLEGESLPFGERVAYQPFVQVLRAAMGVREDDLPAEAYDRVADRLSALLGERGTEMLPFLAALLALPVPEPLAARVRDLDSVAVGRQVFRATRVLFERLAADRPLVLAFEDLHWMDGSSFALLEHVLPLCGEAGVLVCVTSRPGEGPAERLRDIAGAIANRTLEIPLRPLSRAETGELVRNLLALDALPTSIARLIEQRAEGNPFFLEEVMWSCIDLGGVVRDGDEWRVTDELDRLTLPTTLRGLIMARLDRLEAELGQTLKVAAVIGRSFLYRLLRQVDERPSELDGALATLEDLELIAQRARTPEVLYGFKHVLIQETAYESVLVRRRRELHRRVAEAIEQLFADRREEFYGALAYHFARAEEWERAQDYLFKAGDQAGTLAADAEALGHYRAAFDAYVRVFGDRWDPLQRASLERKMAEALFRRGDHVEAQLHLRRALEHLGHPLPDASGLRGAILRELATQIGHRIVPAMLIRRGGAAQREAAAERARIYDALGWIDYYDDPRRLVLYAFRVLNESERDGYDRGIAQGAFGVGFVCDLIPLFGIAASYHRRATRVAERTGNPLSLGYAYLGLAFHGHRLGEWSSALEHWQRAASEFWKAGELRRWGAAMWGRSWLLLTTGRAAESRGVAEEMLRVGRDGADPQVQGWGALLVGRNLRHAGEFARAEERLADAIELLRRVPDHPNVAVGQGDLGASMLRQGRWREALPFLEEAERAMQERRLRGFLALARNALAEAYLAGVEEDSEERPRYRSRADAALDAARRQAKIDREGVAGYLRLRGTASWLGGNQRGARADWARSLAVARRLGAPYEEGRTLLEIARRTGDAARSAEAAAIFKRLGATFELSLARGAVAARAGAPASESARPGPGGPPKWPGNRGNS